MDFPPQSRVEEFKSSNVGLRVVKLSHLTQIRFRFRLSNSANVVFWGGHSWSFGHELDSDNLL